VQDLQTLMNAGEEMRHELAAPVVLLTLVLLPSALSAHLIVGLASISGGGTAAQRAHERRRQYHRRDLYADHAL
jgi:hypothetical protein